jgi:hypothetical protein
MDFSLFGSKNTKGRILQALVKEWPLSMKKMFSSVRKDSEKSVTYQAVYKSVKELLSEGVLSKQEEGYLISPVWVEKSSQFISRLSEAYEKDNLSKSTRIQELNFESISEAWNFLLSRINTNFFGDSAEAYVQIRRFFIFPLSKDDIERFKRFFSSKKVYILCRENSSVDKLAAGFLSSLGANVRTGIECARPTSMIIYGNCVIYTFVIGGHDRESLSNYYKGTKDMSFSGSNLFKAFGNFFFKKIKVKLIINRDPGVVNDVIEQTNLILAKVKFKKA